MPVISCPNGHQLNLRDEVIGKTIRCPSCAATFVAQSLDISVDPQDSVVAPLRSRRRASGGAKGMATALNNFVGRPLMYVGLLLVILGKGCDGLDARGVARTEALLVRAKYYFNTSFEKKIDQAIEEDDNERAENLRKLRDKERKKLEKGEWKDLQESMAVASINYPIAAYWHKWLDLAGTVLLLCGLILVAILAQSSERWIAYIMIGIITFSIYVIGAGWIDVGAKMPQSQIPREFRR